jgi:SAM-dependent methyltransferase
MATELSESDAARFRAFERTRYHALAESYDNFFTPVTTNAIAPLLKAARLKAGDKLLDVACGSGALAAAAREQGAQATGIDLTPGMIALAKARHPGIDFREAEVEHLPFPAGAFDVVACNFGIGHFPYPERAVAECARVLKAGGGLVLAWWDSPDKQRIMGLFRDAVAEIGAQPPPDVPAGYSLFRFSDSGAFPRPARRRGAQGRNPDRASRNAPRPGHGHALAWRARQLRGDRVRHRLPGCGNAGQNSRRGRAPRATLHDRRWTGAAGGFQDCRGSEESARLIGFTEIFCHRRRVDPGCSAAPEIRSHDGVITT